MPESTTPDLVELGDRFLEAVNRRDFDAMLSFFAPDAVWEAGGLGLFEGVAAIRGFLQDWFASYEELWFAREEVFDLGNGVVFSVVNQRGRPVGTSSDIRHRNGVVTVLVDGLLERVGLYSAPSSADIDEARAAAERLARERGQVVAKDATNTDLVEILRHIFDAANRRDVDAVLSFYAPDAVWDLSQRGVGIFEGQRRYAASSTTTSTPSTSLCSSLSRRTSSTTPLYSVWSTSRLGQSVSPVTPVTFICRRDGCVASRLRA